MQQKVETGGATTRVRGQQKVVMGAVAGVAGEQGVATRAAVAVEVAILFPRFSTCQILSALFRSNWSKNPIRTADSPAFHWSTEFVIRQVISWWPLPPGPRVRFCRLSAWHWLLELGGSYVYLLSFKNSGTCSNPNHCESVTLSWF